MGACQGNCPSRQLEADHVTPWYKGGNTEENNLLVLGTVCHAIKHLLDEDYASCRLIYNRMSKEERDMFIIVASGLSYPVRKITRS